MKILITGSNGLLGQKLLHKLRVDNTFEVIATSKGVNRVNIKKGYTFFSLDITNKEEVNKVIINQKIEEGNIENKYLIVNLISNYEHYTLPFRSNNFLNIINRNLENTKVKHLTGGGKHSVSIKLSNFKDEELRNLKEKVKEIS